MNKKTLSSLFLLLAVLFPASAEAADIVMSFVGDCTFGGFRGQGPGGTLAEEFKKRGPRWFFSGVPGGFKDDDVTYINLEGPFSGSPSAARKKFPIWCPLEHAAILKEASVEGANLANNHSRDCGEPGLRETGRILDGLHIGYASEGKPWRASVRGTPVSFHAFQGWNASPAQVRAELARDPARVKVAEFHWGSEYHYRHDGRQEALAHAAVEGGASLVVGAHPHVLQDIEVYKGVPIVYSLGNFIFGANKNPRDKDTAIARVTFPEEGPARVEIIPMRLSSSAGRNDYRPEPADAAGIERVSQKVSGGRPLPESVTIRK